MRRQRHRSIKLVVVKMFLEAVFLEAVFLETAIFGNLDLLGRGLFLLKYR